MKWWYENECEECKKEFYSKPYDHREAGAGQIGYCINCPNSGIRERDMEFDKSRVYTALNADELKAGDKVIVGSSILELKTNIDCNRRCGTIVEIDSECCGRRFVVDGADDRGTTFWELAYLVERAENCLKCKKNHKYYGGCEHLEPWCLDDDMKKTLTCSEYVPADPDEYKEWMPKAEPKTTEKLDLVSLGNGQYAERATEKKYRPFRDCDELIKVWDEKTKPYRADTKLPPIIMPLIWVQVKKNGRRFALAELDERILGYLFSDCTFLDGSTCGVEE